MCEGIDDYVDPVLNLFIVGQWSEYWEGNVLEPTEEWGFSYLKILKDEFGE